MNEPIPFENLGKSDTIEIEAKEIIKCFSCERDLVVRRGVCYVICPNCLNPTFNNCE